MRVWLRRASLFVAGCAFATCGIAAEPLRVLFVGNSHTYTNDLPRAVVALAAQRGVEIEATTLAEPGYSLGDHLEGPWLRRLLQREWDWVVLQQGTSSLPESRQDLIASAQRIAKELHRPDGIARIGLTSIWPQRRYRRHSLAAEASYRAAAEAMQGCVFPAATAWRLAQQSSDAPRLYQADKHHATRAGTMLMALTILPGLIGAERSGLEHRVDHPGASESADVRVLQAAAWQAHREEPQRCETR